MICWHVTRDVAVPLPAVLGCEGAGQVERARDRVMSFAPMIALSSLAAEPALIYSADALLSGAAVKPVLVTP